jgi:hypothetical protein
VFPAECNNLFTDPSDAAIFGIAYCDNQMIETSLGDFNRENVAITAVIIDMVICAVFVWAVWMQKKWFIKEDQDYDQDNICVSDFTVTITNLPDEIQYGSSLDNLKA